MTDKPPATPRYHHGDLHSALLREAALLLRDDGVEALSLRRLAERTGVSRMAPYHHFKDKHALLCALASEGFRSLDSMITDAQLAPGADLGEGLRDFVRAYLRFAMENPEQYELMFGRAIWKNAEPTAELRDIAYHAFRHYAERIGALVSEARLPQGSRPLRLAQASWATLHGLCKLMLDGIYVDRGDMEEVSEEAVRLMVAVLGKPEKK
jgi:AcrR family transcriptional regulator